MDDTDDYLAEVAAAMLKAIAEAKNLAEQGDIGTEFRELLDQARELYDIAMKELAALPDAGEFILGMARTYGAKLEEMLALTDDSVRQ